MSPIWASISCAHFQRFSNSVAHLFKQKTGKKTNNYLDDFLFAALLKALCDGHVQIFLDLCKLINFPVALDKTFWGCQLIVFLGIMLDTLAQSVIVPEAKVKKAVHQIRDIFTGCKTMVLKLQKLMGLFVPCHCAWSCLYSQTICEI